MGELARRHADLKGNFILVTSVPKMASGGTRRIKIVVGDATIEKTFVVQSTR
jgi:hypothetical protein